MRGRWPGAARFGRQPIVRAPLDGRLPRFAGAIGLDVIVTPEGRAVLVELQHGFGRQGLVTLFPEAARWYRRRLRALKRDRGPCLALTTGLRRICADKVNTYRSFSRFQPPSFLYLRRSPEVSAWLDGVRSELFLSKPPRGSNGRGIRVFDRDELRSRAESGRLPKPSLLQAFVHSRALLDEEGLPHLGCIRHVVVLDSDGETLRLLHMPSYWRVAPVPLLERTGRPVRRALTANISRGAYPLRLDHRDAAAVRDLADRVCPELVALALGLAAPPPCRSVVVSERGGEPAAEALAL